MKIKAIGTGSAFARPPLFNASLLVTTGKEKYVVDCGCNVPYALEKVARQNLKDVDGVLITHVHMDHIGGLEEWAFKNMYVYGKARPMLMAPAVVLRDLQKRLMPALWKDHTGKLELKDYFRIKEVEPDKSYKLGECSVTFIPVKHVPAFPSFGLYFKHPKKRVFFSADAIFDANLIEKMAAISDIIIYDTQLFTGGVHASLEELQTLPKEMKKKIFCHHYGNNFRQFRPAPMRWLKQGQVI